MHVPVLSIIFMCISASVSIGAPIYIFLLFRKKYDARIIPMALGIAGFIIFALVLEGSIHRIVLGKYALKETPALYILYGIFMAGIFEETARFIAFKILKRKYKGIVTGLAYGIGHGGIESIMLAGVSMIIAIVASIIINTGNMEFITNRFQGDMATVIQSQIADLTMTAPYLFLVSSLERMFAISIQIALSIMVFYAVYGKNKLWLYPLAIIFHAIIDIPAAAIQAGIINNIIKVEAVIAVSAVLAVLISKYLHESLKSSLITEPENGQPDPNNAA